VDYETTENNSKAKIRATNTERHDDNAAAAADDDDEDDDNVYNLQHMAYGDAKIEDVFRRCESRMSRIDCIDTVAQCCHLQCHVRRRLTISCDNFLSLAAT